MTKQEWTNTIELELRNAQTKLWESREYAQDGEIPSSLAVLAQCFTALTFAERYVQVLENNNA